MIEFFRDTLSGVYYYIYVAVDLLLIFALVGYIGEHKEEEFLQEEASQINTQISTKGESTQQENHQINKPQI